MLKLCINIHGHGGVFSYVFAPAPRLTGVQLDINVLRTLLPVNWGVRHHQIPCVNN